MIKKRKGILLAGGSGTRLNPITKIISKQLLPVYNKPMIYYPLSVLMLAGIKEILIITDESNSSFFKKLLGDGSQYRLKLSYEIQLKPRGIAEALIIGEQFLNGSPVALILGDNIFFGSHFRLMLNQASMSNKSSIFLYQVPDPHRFGVAELNSKKQVIDIKEKPKNPKSSYAVTGLYFYDQKASDYAKKLKTSKRGELEITDLNKIYIKKNKLVAQILGRGFSWYDTGTFNSLNDASNMIRNIEENQNLKIAFLLEIAFHNKWLNKKELIYQSKSLSAIDRKYVKTYLV